ncbi:MAG: hypothetical protein ABI596_17555 [Pyrinomonadaceae bacterium]
MRPKTITLTFALAFAASALFAGNFPASLAQEGQRRKGTEKAPGGCFICGNMQGMHTAMFDDADWFGTLSWDACPIKKYSEDHPEKMRDVCRKIKADLNFTSFKQFCPSLAPYCESEDKPPDTKCVPPRPETKGPPYFDPQTPCRDRQRGSMSWSKNRSTGVHSFTVSMCGQVIRFKQPDYGSFPNRPLGVKSFDVCCEAWRNSVNTNSPCDVSQDIDCDGATNDVDTDPVSYGYDSFWSGRSDDFASSSPLTNLPFWKQLYKKMPTPSECKDCKWELLSVKYQCDSEARAYHYQATWKCPGSGETRETNETADMTERRCPVPPNRSWP